MHARLRHLLLLPWMAVLPVDEGLCADLSPSTIENWVARLDDANYSVREEATLRLVAAGAAAAGPVAAAIEDATPEMRSRGFIILGELAASEDVDVLDAIEKALASIVGSPHASVAKPAARLASDIRRRRRDLAVAAITELGGQVSVGSDGKTQISIRGGWKGGDEGLRRLLLLFPDLTWLSLEDSPVGDAGLEHVGQLKKLKFLYLGDSQVKGPGLVHLAGLKELEHLSLRYLKIDERWLKTVGEMTHLESLGLDDTQFTDDSLRMLAKMENLRRLWLDRSRVTGAGIARLSLFKKLEMLDLGGLALTDADLAPLAKLPRLETLYLDNMPLTDDALGHLDALTTLRQLNIDGTKITEAGVEKLKEKLPDVTVSR